MKRGTWWVRAGLVAATWWLLWSVWNPVLVQLPADLVRVADGQALDALPLGASFLIEGKVTPAPGSVEREWLGRFAYVRKEWQDRGGSGSSKHLVLTVVEDHRPALYFDWAGGRWEISAGSYALDWASPVKPRAWPRKWFWTTREDMWDESSTGLRKGETVLALGKFTRGAPAVVESLLRTPLASVVAELNWENRTRGWLTLAAKIVLTIAAGSLLIPPREKTEQNQSGPAKASNP